MNKVVWCLHGFLGTPEDWNHVRDLLQEDGIEVRTIDLWQSFVKVRPSGLHDWAEALLDEVSAPPTPLHLVGYSLGGRLVAHMLARSRDGVALGVCVGGHLGRQSDTERAERLAGDLRWAERFRVEAWPTLLNAWNDQAVFRGSRLLPRDESRFNRTVLAEVLECGSLGRQVDLIDDLRHDSRLWLVAGSEDSKFAPLYEQWHRDHLPHAHVAFVKGAGHRAPWDAPKEFAQLIGAIVRCSDQGEQVTR